MNDKPITRHQIDVNGRRVHYRRCGRGPAVAMLHASPRSGAALATLMRQGPDNVTMLAFDTPGCGDSEPLALPRPEAADYADALADTLAALGVDQTPVYGTHTGAAIAMAFAIRHPQRVTTLVLDGVSVFNAAERAQIFSSYLPSFAPQIDGTHLTRLWSRVRDQHLFFPWNHRGTGARLWRPLPTAELIHAGVLDLLRAGDPYREPYSAAIRYQPPDWMAELRVPALIAAREDDLLLPHLERLGARPAQVRVERLSADPALAGARLWAELAQAGRALPSAPDAADAALPQDRLGSSIVGPEGRRIHLRGALGGGGRPLVMLHDSPGGARGLEASARREVGIRPVLVPDLPSHGDSDRWQGPCDASSLALEVHATLQGLGVDEADVEGIGVGGLIAATMARLHPARYRAAPATTPSAEASAAPAFAPRADGGHLQAAWLYARDEAILGPLWTRRPDDRHDFGDDIDLERVHRRCTEALKEAPEAAELRDALLRAAR